MAAAIALRAVHSGLGGPGVRPAATRGPGTRVGFFVGAWTAGSSVTAESLSQRLLRRKRETTSDSHFAGLRGSHPASTRLPFEAGPGDGFSDRLERKGAVQPGIVGLRGAITAAWEDDLRAVRQDRYDTAAGKEALAFIQRCYSLVSDLRAPIQKAWGQGGHVHVADSANIIGPGPRVSQTRLRLRNHGDMVAVEAFTYADGTSKHNASLGLDREIKVVGVSPLSFVQELYRTTLDFLQVALSLDLALGGSAWLFEQMVAYNFVATGQWPTLGDVYQRITRELAVEDSFERVAAMFAPVHLSNGASGSNGSS